MFTTSSTCVKQGGDPDIGLPGSVRIQGVSRAMVNILGDGSMDYSE